MDRHIGNRLRTFRQDKGLSQSQLAAQAGLAVDQIKSGEAGARRFSATELWKLCGVFDVSPGAFFEP